ncbi:hypothetical protein FACS1894167_06790 [Synergistales bacterium]|nr:hypothetical protein FACS1894167_06790 [Synergistales bacterium]
MIYSADFLEMAGKINHVEVAKYLRDLGWVSISSKRINVKIFQLEKGDSFFQVDLPADRGLRDYKSAMYHVVENIALSVDKSTEQVILELLNPMSDILKLRIKEPDSESGSIYMEEAITLYENAKKLITATAMDILHPRLYHSGRPDNAIAEFVANCRFGQTEIGSYVVSVACPISIIDKNQCKQLSLFNKEDELADSLTRNVVNKLIISAHQVREAIDQGNLEEFIHANAETKDCISANFLDALSGINIYREDSALDIALKYAPTISKNRIENLCVSINHDYYEPINTFINSVNTVQESEMTCIGRISKLHASPDAERRNAGEITIVFINEDEKKATVSAHLTKEDYDAAIDAHREGKTVKVIGTLSGQTKKTKKIECSYFGII